MTDFILDSGQSSVILRNLEERSVVDLSYDAGASYPILAKQYRELQPNNTAVLTYGGEVVFNINKSMLLNDMLIRSSFTTATTPMAGTTPVGLSVYEWIQLRTNNKVIATLSDAYILARVHNATDSEGLAHFRRALPLLSTTEMPSGAVGTVVTYTPVFSSFFETVRNAFDLNFYEQLSLAAKVNQQGRGQFPGGLTALSATLWVRVYRPDDKFYDLLRAKNQNPAKPLIMLTYNSYTESQVLTAAGTTSMRLNVNNPVFKTHFFIKGATTTAGVMVHPFPIKIDSFTFSVGGTRLLESVPYQVGNWESSKAGSGSLIPGTVLTQTATTPALGSVLYNDTKVITIDWGMEPLNRITNSGAVSFAQINYPQLTVNYGATALPAGAFADYTLYVVHEFWQILDLDSANGSVQVVAFT